jgi:hypothetical protein
VIHESHESSGRVREIFVLGEIDSSLDRFYTDAQYADKEREAMARRSGASAFVLSVFVLLLVTACVGGSNPLIGKWHATQPAIAFEFFQDGTVTLKQDGRTFSGRYKSLDSENIKVNIYGGLSLQSFVLEDVKIAGDTLTVTLTERQIVFSRSIDNDAQSPVVDSQTGATPQSTPSSLTDSNGVPALAGKWMVEPKGVDPDLYEFVERADGKIVMVATFPNGRSAARPGELDIRPVGGGKFVGYFIYYNTAYQYRAIEIQLLDNDQRLTIRQATDVEGKWNTSSFVKVVK